MVISEFVSKSHFSKLTKYPFGDRETQRGRVLTFWRLESDFK